MALRVALVLLENRRYFIVLYGWEAVFFYWVLLLIGQRWVARRGHNNTVIHEVWLCGPNTVARHPNPPTRMLHLDPRF
jgi:hypothetical protein